MEKDYVLVEKKNWDGLWHAHYYCKRENKMTFDRVTKGEAKELIAKLGFKQVQQWQLPEK